MSSEPPTLRPARPVLDDGRSYAGYLDTAAEGFFRAMLGGQVERIVAEAFLQTGHDLSHEHVTFAERDGRIVGMVSGYTAEEHAQSSDQVLVEAAGPARAARMAILSVVGRPVLQFLEHVPEGDFYLQAVAVDDHQRGSGIGTMLIDHIEARAKESGCSRLVLDVSADNDGARRLYERLGMTVGAESPHPPLMPNMRAQRMVKPL
ncbi:MAG: GNAT family N-acetyltransferase [Acidimicrobiales bacterium]|nr:GNAT family N-acetyltransferase [Acidimicrobiales bacterium]RZV43807.1 MAG: GNAT family N-acetyltransferase [Acidimicrobiales bacterium]